MLEAAVVEEKQVASTVSCCPASSPVLCSDAVAFAGERMAVDMSLVLVVAASAPARQLVGCRRADSVCMRSSAVEAGLGYAQGDLEVPSLSSFGACAAVGLAWDAAMLVRKAVSQAGEVMVRAETEEASHHLALAESLAVSLV